MEVQEKVDVRVEDFTFARRLHDTSSTRASGVTGCAAQRGENNKSSRDFRQLLHNDVSKLEATQLISLEALLRSLFTSYHKSSCQKIEEQKTRGTGQALKPHVKDGKNTRKSHC